MIDEQVKEMKREVLRSRLAANIRVELNKQKIDMDELSERSGIPKNSIYRYRRCEVGASIDAIADLACGLKVRPGVLLMPVEIDAESDE